MVHNKFQDIVDVLIVGAGPTGLMMACQLAILGIRFRIIDKKDLPSSNSGALIVHARSVEIFNQMGIAEKVLQNAIIANKLSIVFNGKKIVQIFLKNIGQGFSKFPNLHLIEQSMTEQLLNDFITDHGFLVERKTELISFNQDEKGVNSTYKLPDGTEETINTKYLIAADGGHSFVREQLKIPFKGKTHPVSLFIIDCKTEQEIAKDEMCFTFSDASTSGFFPLKEGRKRVDGILPKELKGNEHVKFEDIEKSFAKKLNMKIRLYDPEWFSISHSNQRYALTYQENRCFLIGDAAHIFTPVGAQGMNTGLQDAYNLAWKLAFVIQGKAKTSLLNTYSKERKQIAKKTVRFTGKIYNLVTSQHFFTKTFRMHILPYLMIWTLPLIEKRKWLRKFCFYALSEIGINYRKSPLSQDASKGNFPDNAPKPGDRLPYLVFKDKDKEINIQEKITGTGFSLFLFTKDSPLVEMIKVAEKYKNVLSFEIIPFTTETKFLYDHFSIKNGGYYLIRPDMYIAYRSAKLNPFQLENYLQQYLMFNP